MMTRVLLVALVIISSVYAVDPLIEELAAQISEANLKYASPPYICFFFFLSFFPSLSQN